MSKTSIKDTSLVLEKPKNHVYLLVLRITLTFSPLNLRHLFAREICNVHSRNFSSYIVFCFFFCFIFYFFVKNKAVTAEEVMRCTRLQCEILRMSFIYIWEIFDCFRICITRTLSE